MTSYTLGIYSKERKTTNLECSISESRTNLTKTNKWIRNASLDKTTNKWTLFRKLNIEHLDRDNRFFEQKMCSVIAFYKKNLKNLK